MRRLKRRETQVSIIRAAVTYLGFATAAVLSVGQLIGGVDRLTALAGASFLLILVGFAIQRVLMDIIAGLVMFMERWYSVGDTIQIPMHELQGIVEDVSLRHTRLRTLDGEVIHIHNSQIPSVRVLPSGVKELQLEVFVTDRERGIEMVESVLQILPRGPDDLHPATLDRPRRRARRDARAHQRAGDGRARPRMARGRLLRRPPARAGRARRDRPRPRDALGRRVGGEELLARERRDAAVERMVAVGL